MCKVLFPDRITRKRTRQGADTLGNKQSIREAVEKALESANLIKNQVAKKHFRKVFSKLNKDDLETLLRTYAPATIAPVQQEMRIETIMNLYLHSIALHFPNVYEEIDFRNTSTERGEGFFAHLHTILLRCSGRDLQTAAPLREVFVRIGMQTQSADIVIDWEASQNRIRKAFAGLPFYFLIIFNAPTRPPL